MTILELLEDMPCRVTGSTAASVSGIVYDSRKVKPGSVFVCLVGSKTDSHVFAEQAAEAGAAAIVTQHDIPPVPCTEIRVKDTREALAFLSAAWFGYPAQKMKVIGVTGTKGKTTCTYMIHSILESAGISTGIIGTIGTVIGRQLIPTSNTTPESYDIQKFMHMMVEAGCKVCVLEASSIGLRDHRVDGFTFDIGLFTNFSEDHIGGNEHKDMQEYMACKALLFHKCRLGVINTDDANWKGITAGHTCSLTTYGFGETAQLRAENDRLISKPGYLGIEFDLCGSLQGHVCIDIPGKFNVYNALGAVAVCQQFDITLENIQKGLDTVKVKGRVEPVPVPGNYTLLIDYAHNAVSMQNILTTLRQYHPNRLVCMFGAGGNRPKIRRYEMGEMSGNLADLSVITADNSRDEDVMDILADIEVGLHKTSGKYVVIPDRKEAIQYCLDTAQDGDVIVLAGKGHEMYQEIKGVKYPFDERKIVHNILTEEGKLPLQS
jgi:UDP-N-acetylmuramoyl-L-alanyl-D-glutamate--2,6-diaminopimelate ligase